MTIPYRKSNTENKTQKYNTQKTKHRKPNTENQHTENQTHTTMSKSQYDTDVCTFNPQGRLYQIGTNSIHFFLSIEYAIEAVKQGAASIGLVSSTAVVLVSLKRVSSELASYQEKIFTVAPHMGVAVAGLIADARVLTKFMHAEALHHSFVYGSNVQVGRIVQMVADKKQIMTQKNTKRPYGVGLLVAGVDKTGPKLFETDPAGNFWEWKAQAIGARAQTAKTYLEKHIESFDSLGVEELIVQALNALKGTSQAGEFNEKSVSIGYASIGKDFVLAGIDDVKRFLQNVDVEIVAEEKKEEIIAADNADPDLAVAEEAAIAMDQS